MRNELGMDYEKELFAQYTPYLQWKLHTQDAAEQMDKVILGEHTYMFPRKLDKVTSGKHVYMLPRKLDKVILGKHVYMLPFCSCTDKLETLLDMALLDEEGLYIFAEENGRIAENALQEFAAVFAGNPEAEVVYADEDYFGTLEELYHISENHFSKEALFFYRDAETGLFCGKPWFKPDFSPDTLQSFFYMGNIFAVCAKTLKSVWEPQDSLYQLIARVAKNCVLDKQAGNGRSCILHLPKVLFTNQNIAESEKLYGAGALGAVLPIPSKPLVSIIIPSKDHAEILGRCLYTLVQYTRYPNYEVLIVDNGSSDVEKARLEKLFDEIRSIKEGLKLCYLYKKQPFNFSAMCNQGAQAAKGEYLLFLNDDIEVICTADWEVSQQDNQYRRLQPDWLSCMMQLAVSKHAGAVGAKLYYPKAISGKNQIREAENEITCNFLQDEGYKIQHTGITNMGVGPAHKLCGIEDKGNLYHGVNLVNYNMLAVTAACLLVKRDKFARIGGFDESLAVAYNDVELCFRLYQAGFYNILCNQAVLVHHESLSRGADITPERQKRLSNEKKILYQKHPNMEGYDPFYSPNLVQWEKDVLYNTGYQYQCDKPVIPKLLSKKELQSLPKVFKNKYLRKVTGENRVMFAMDGVEDDYMGTQGMLRITGWYVITHTDNAKVVRTLLLRSVDTESIIYKLPVFPKLRQDVEDLFANETGSKRTLHTALSGIQVIVHRNVLQKGCYEIGFYAKGRREYLTWSGRCLEID